MKKDCLGRHLLPLPICLPHANAFEDDEVAQKEWKTKGERENIGLCIQNNPQPRETARA